MGVIYEAEQISLSRRVALKVLSPNKELTEDHIARFRREAEACGRQSHPGIVAVHAVGETGGRHYIAMELVPDARTLADWFTELRGKERLPKGTFREVAKIFARVCDALAHAHQQGVVHRDVKPSSDLSRAIRFSRCSRRSCRARRSIRARAIRGFHKT